MFKRQRLQMLWGKPCLKTNSINVVCKTCLKDKQYKCWDKTCLKDKHYKCCE